MKALAAACLLAWSLGAQALTVGPAVVNSSLGEPLKAEFPLTGLTEGQKRDLQARVADDSAYEAARLERPPALDGLGIRVETRNDGSHALVLYGQQSVQMPFVDVLVELRWQGGRLLRELTVLLQPQSSDKPVNLSPARLVVQPGDTAGQLARDHKHERVSLEQTLLALLQQNPDAFVDGNINRLRSGSLLSLPSAAEAGSIEQDTARAALQAQAEAFNTWRAGLSQRVTADDAPDAADGTRLQIPPRLPAQTAAPQDRLELTKPGNSQEDQIALQRQAKDTAERAAELARNIAELGKIAGGQGTPDDNSPNGLPLPAPNVPAHGRLIDLLREHPLTPVAAGMLVALLVLMSLWRTRVRTSPEASPITQVEVPDSKVSSEPFARSPFPIDLDLNLPHLDSPVPETSSIPVSAAPVTSVSPAPRPALGSPFAGLSLDLHTDQPAGTGNFPFAPQPVDPVLQVRLALAQTLWEAGQQQTARVLAQEVAAQAREPLHSMARDWLASHT